MTGAIVIMPTVNVPPPSPPASSPGGSPAAYSSAPQDTSQDNAGQAAPASNNTPADNTNNAASTGSADNSSNSNSTGAADNTNNSSGSFSKLLASNQGTGSAANTNSNSNTASGQGAQGQGAANDSSAAAVASGDTGSGNIVVSSIATLLVMIQGQVQGGNATGAGAAQNASTQLPNLSSQDNSLLQELQQILQQLMQQAASQSATVQLTAGVQPQTPSSGNPQQQNAGNDGNNSGNSLAQMLAQLLGVLSQITQSPDFQSLQSNLNTLTVTSDGQSATNVLSQLAQALENNLGLAQGGNDPAGSSTGGSTTANTPSVFDNLISSFLNSVPPSAAVTASASATGNNASSDITNQLQTALTNVINMISSAQAVTTPDPSGSGNNTGNSNNQNNNNNNTPNNSMPAFGVVNNASQISTSDFVTLTTTPPPAAPVLDQVMVQIKTATATGNNIIQIQLQPADLGKVEVRMVTGADGNTSISITSDNRNTLALLQNEAQSLQSALRDIGFKTTSGGLSFNLSSQQQNTSNFNGNNGNGYTQVAPVDSADDPADYGTIIASYNVSVTSGLNIQV